MCTREKQGVEIEAYVVFIFCCHKVYDLPKIFSFSSMCGNVFGCGNCNVKLVTVYLWSGHAVLFPLPCPLPDRYSTYVYVIYSVVYFYPFQLHFYLFGVCRMSCRSVKPAVVSKKKTSTFACMVLLNYVAIEIILRAPSHTFTFSTSIFLLFHCYFRSHAILSTGHYLYAETHTHKLINVQMSLCTARESPKNHELAIRQWARVQNIKLYLLVHLRECNG